MRVLNGVALGAPAEPIVAAHGVSMAFHGNLVLEDVSFDIQPGEVVAVLGGAGSAKTTLFELLLGLLRPTEGSIRVFGRDISEMTKDARSRIGWAADPPELVGQLRAEQHIDLMGSFHARWDGSRVRSLCLEGGVDLREPVAQMTAARRKTFSVLLALGHGPELLLVDEPVAGLADRERRWLLESLARFSAREGATLVLFSSTAEVAEIASRSFWIVERRLAVEAPRPQAEQPYEGAGALCGSFGEARVNLDPRLVSTEPD